MKKKGFTLIELLAVIVILAIIALIIVPVVSNVVNSAKETVFRASVGGIIDSASTYLQKYVTHRNNIFPITFTCNGTSCSNGNDLLAFDGKVPVSGRIVISEDGGILAEYVTDGKLCAYGYRWDLEVGSCISLDHTAPVIDDNKLESITLTSTTNSITVSFPEDLMYDGETEIEYKIKLYLNGKKIGERDYSNSVTFNNLKNDTEYTIVISCTNQNNLTTTINKIISTSDIVKPTIAYTNDPTSDVNGYFRSQTLNVTYTKGNVENPEYYIRSGRDASTNINVIGSCGSETIPSECITVDTNSIEADIWYKVSGSINVIYNVDSNTDSGLTAIINDGLNYASSDTKVVAKIDGTAPTTPTGGAIGNVSGSIASASIQTAASGSTDAGVDGIVYKYLVTNSNTTPDKNNTNFTTSRNFTRQCGASYYGWAIAEDALGNRSEVKALGSTSDGANSYSGWTGCSKTCGGGTQTRTNTCALVTTGLSQACNTQSCCSFAVNQTVFSQTTAGAYSFTVPSGCGGTYTLQVYGAQGGAGGGGNCTRSVGGKGGYAYGNVRLTAGTTIYIYVGGTTSNTSGGYNGGGSGKWDGGGGGATHMGKTNGLLSNTSASNLYIVAGGGGGTNCGVSEGGTGGGTSGGTGFDAGCGSAAPGTQNSGYAYGQGGYGGNDEYNGAGGGGGYYGGRGSDACRGYWSSGGGGGSGYLSSYLISGTTGMQNGQKSGAGAAYIIFRSFN